MQIEKGHIVTFTEALSNPVHGAWSTYEKVIRFPEGLTPEIEKLMKGKKVNDYFSIPVTHFDEGVYDQALIIKIPKANLRGAPELKVGMVFKAVSPEAAYAGFIKEISKNEVLLDCNHPATCHKNVTVSIRIINIREPSEAEQQFPFKATTKLF